MVGMLRASHFGFELRVDGGGQWEVYETQTVRKLLGHRVELEGIRVGFNTLEAMSVTPLDIKDLPEKCRKKWRIWNPGFETSGR